ncbi:hypothetical protein BK809_0002962 [Diplodia seriata]|uniref:BTB domain-containing protein n=1 Tax=Diplodia seriata TaxID=420778 RepID=A0A1S8BL97_9PEZI|nr:hypothetical protein BK809_0002962 [Diplodia seriata]
MHDWIELPEDDPDIFEVYLQWLYLKTIEITAGQDAPQHFAMYESYKFGDKILDTAFKNAVIDHLIRSVVTNQVYPTYLAKAVYQNLPASSGLRRLYVDFWAWASCVEWYDGGAAGIEEAPLEFFSELSRKQTEIKDKRSVRKEKFPWVIDACQYHEHAEGSPKCSNKPNK